MHKSSFSWIGEVGVKIRFSVHLPDWPGRTQEDSFLPTTLRYRILYRSGDSYGWVRFCALLCSTRLFVYPAICLRNRPRCLGAQGLWLLSWSFQIALAICISMWILGTVFWHPPPPQKKKIWFFYHNCIIFTGQREKFWNNRILVFPSYERGVFPDAFNFLNSSRWCLSSQHVGLACFCLAYFICSMCFDAIFNFIFCSLWLFYRNLVKWCRYDCVTRNLARVRF